MSKFFRDWNPEQAWLLPPSVKELVPAGHIAHFVRELVREQIDLSPILSTYKQERGYPPYDPTMMTALLLFAYAQGVRSSRKIAKACEERLDFMAVTAAQKPDFRTVNEFRLRHLKALQGLFSEVLRLCRQAGLCKLGHVAIDGTKIKANASKHKAMSYGRMKQAIPQYEQEIARWFEQSKREDEEEDREHGREKRGDEMPQWVASKQKRLEKMKEAKAALEAEQKSRDGDDEPEPSGPGRPRKRKNGEPEDKAQRNFTDPDSRIMKSGDGYVQGYNAQAAVDSANQVIVACGLTTNAADSGQLLPMLDAVKKNLGQLPKEVSADKGYLSEENLQKLQKKKTRAYIATGRQKHWAAGAVYGQRSGKPLTKKMAQRLKQGGWRSRYRLRKITVEPVFGQIKAAGGFRTFSFRGEEKVRAEWGLVCSAHNLLKLYRAR